MLMGELQRRLDDGGRQPEMAQQNMVRLTGFMNGQQIPSREEQMYAKLKEMAPNVIFHGNHVYLCTHRPGANGYGNYKCWKVQCRARIHYHIFTHEITVIKNQHEPECDMEFYNMRPEARAFLEECRKFVQQYQHGHRTATAMEIYKELAKTVSETFKCRRIPYLATWKNVDYWMSGSQKSE